MMGWTLHHHIIPYVISAGLYGVSRVGSINIDHALMTALVERWRQETHTFDLPVGEATIALHDVAVLLGLRIDDRAVVSPLMHDVQSMSEELLGMTPDDRALTGTRL